MAGLDSLLLEIQKLAKDEADRILSSAEAEASKIEEENAEKIESRTKEILAEAETTAKNISERGASGCRIEQRNKMLMLKRSLIQDTVAKAKQNIIALPDPEYFSLLKGWAGKSDISGKAFIHLNKKDIARDKGDFLKSFPDGADVELVEEPADISGGFLAVCGGVTINCSVDAMLDIHSDVIHNEIQRILFGEHGNEE